MFTTSYWTILLKLVIAMLTINYVLPAIKLPGNLPIKFGYEVGLDLGSVGVDGTF
jgi:hypothetical protein